ncbi:hypothetical protein D3C81_1771470 [compost metagenome]
MYFSTAGVAGWSALDFPVAIQFVRQARNPQAWPLQTAQVQVVILHGLGTEYRKQLAALAGAGRNDHFANR